mmetsp:Transcript_27469/g.50702  ORF Transcript_27469/g.50702 Transcript_27469/m.50702 type:complete len:117 (-) Transcript_27469:2161-2511(-)
MTQENKTEIWATLLKKLPDFEAGMKSVLQTTEVMIVFGALTFAWRQTQSLVLLLLIGLIVIFWIGTVFKGLIRVLANGNRGVVEGIAFLFLNVFAASIVVLSIYSGIDALAKATGL